MTQGVSLYAGVSYRLQLTANPTPELGEPLLVHDFAGPGSLTVRGFPALVGSVELF